jgi:desulfoferrodoxin (superoxide reductase-like protein)
MKRTAVFLKCVYGALLVTLVIYCVYPVLTYANSPQNVNLKYDISSQYLTVTITHKSAATDKHYIESVIIKKNGKVSSTYNYASQPDPETFTYTYQVQAEAGDVLEVTAQCNIFGNKKETLNIKKD